MQAGRGHYARVNGLKMYYEIYGSGRPLVLLHGGFGTAESWANLLPILARKRQVVVMDMQGHGRTADIDRPLSVLHMADDTAALLQQLKIENADLFGHSMGGVVALGAAIRHPGRVRKLAIAGSGYGPFREALDAEVYRQISLITPENFHFPGVKESYVRVAPDPTKWPVLIARLAQMTREFEGYSEGNMRALKCPTLIMLGDQDALRTEHAMEMVRLIPDARLAIFPGADHFVPFTHPDRVLPELIAFLEAPLPNQDRVTSSPAGDP